MTVTKNNYILTYYQQIKDGTAVVGKWIELVYEYIVNGIQTKAFFYDHKKAERVIRFIETFGHHHEGSNALIKLELWQKALLASIYGIVDKNGLRQFQEVVISMGRGNGKTLLGAMMALNELFVAEGYGKRVYFAAPKLDQAHLAFDAFYQTIVNEEELQKLASKRRTDVYVKMNNSSAKPLAYNERTSDGYNISFCLCDEFSVWAGDKGLKFYQALKSGTSKRKEPLMVSISTAGYINDGVYDELFARSTRMLLGESKETKLLPFFYMIDDEAAWNDINELQKANPNLGVSVTVDNLLEYIRIAESGDASARSEFKTKYANIKQNSSTAWLPSATVKKSQQKHVELEDLRDSYGIAGLDLSQTVDLTSACVLVEKNGILNIVSHFWLPEARLEDAIIRDKVPYDKYISAGILSTSGENFVDYEDCFQWCLDLMYKHEIYPLKVGYDRYSAQYLIKALQGYYQCEDVFQGDNLWGVMQELEGLMKDGRVNIGDNGLLTAHLLNSGVKMNLERGRGRLIKISPELHIDGTAAILCAMAVRNKYYLELEHQLRNEED